MASSRKTIQTPHVSLSRIERKGIRVELTPIELDGAVSVALRAFGRGMSAREVTEHVLPVDVLYLAWKADVVVGFASLSFNQSPPYFAGTVVDPAHQGEKIYMTLARQRILDTIERGHNSFMTRTQNPVIEHALTRSLTSLVAEQHIKNFDIRRELAPKVYGRMLTAERPFSRDETVNTIYAQLNYMRGDAFKLTFVLQ
ncbi:hypothetical protein HYZ97_04325 [Candidatus Pacearchaeota archaeon]|nr:hypothetical protein [Candidatus Pacearchaeota archaeon]